MNLGPNIILDSKQNFETLIMVSGKKKLSLLQASFDFSFHQSPSI